MSALRDTSQDTRVVIRHLKLEADDLLQNIPPIKRAVIGEMVGDVFAVLHALLDRIETLEKEINGQS